MPEFEFNALVRLLLQMASIILVSRLIHAGLRRIGSLEEPHVVLHNVRWEDYERIGEALRDLHRVLPGQAVDDEQRFGGVRRARHRLHLVHQLVYG